MRRIVLCFDGTWNKPADENLAANEQVETNVCRFYKSVKEVGADGAQQLKWYDEGVGTKWYDRFIAAGLELDSRRIFSMATNFSPKSIVKAMKFTCLVSAAALIPREVSLA